MLERKLTEARLRYKQSMSLSAHFDPVAEAPPGLQRRRSRMSFFEGSRVDPSSFILTDMKSPRSEHSLQRTASTLARERVHKTNFEGGVMNPSLEASTKSRKVTQLSTPRTRAMEEDESPRSLRSGKKIAKADDPVGEWSVASVTGTGGAASVNNNSMGINHLLSPGRTTNRSEVTSALNSSRRSEASQRLRTQVKVHMAQHEANHMNTSNIVPPGRKQSRWSRKKSIDAGKAAFLAMTSPKKYGFNKPPMEAPLVTGHGAAPTNLHRKNFPMVVSARQAVLPPWATER